MDTTTLVNIIQDQGNSYDEGKKLIENLDNQGLVYPVTLWIKFPDREGWILLIGIPEPDQTGAREIYGKLHNIIINNELGLSLNDISLVDTQHDICQSLKLMLHTGNTIGKITFTGNIINGRSFPDSIIYRVNL